MAEDEGGHSRSANTLTCSQTQGFLGGRFERGQVHGVLVWDGTADADALQVAVPLYAGSGGYRFNSVKAVRYGASAGTHIEGREVVCLPTNDGHSLRPKIFQRQVKVETQFGSR